LLEQDFVVVAFGNRPNLFDTVELTTVWRDHDWYEVLSKLPEILFSFMRAVTIIQNEWLFSNVNSNLSANFVEEVIELVLVCGLSSRKHSFI